MEITVHPESISATLLEQFLAHKLIYGIGNQYQSLVSPTSTTITDQEARELSDDLLALWTLYKTWNMLYLNALAGDMPSFMKDYSEFGLSDAEIQAQQMVSRAGLAPHLCRVDYVTLGQNRQIAEVQWKSGELGLFFGIQHIFSQVIPPTINTPRLSLTQAFCELALGLSHRAEAVVVNGIPGAWFKSENFLKNAAVSHGVRYFPVHFEQLAGRIMERSGKFFLSEGQVLHPIDFFYGNEFGMIWRHNLSPLVRATIEGRIWLESPLNFIYRQKWGLSLPFMPEYQHLFNDRARKILIPTAMLNEWHGRMDLSPLIPYLQHPNSEQLCKITEIEALAFLPTALRQSLVVKCGAGTGEYYAQGKGVFRLTGSQSAAKKTLQFVQSRIQLGEPWIVQKYVNQTYPIPVSFPDNVEETVTIQAHARFMVYGRRLADQLPTFIGGLGNYGSHWKVSGKTPDSSWPGVQDGTAFNDIRLG